MATIRVAESKHWTDSLTALLSDAGYDIIADGATELAFVDAAELDSLDSAASIIVAPPDRIDSAIEKVKGGEAYAFIRYPFVADEVMILAARTLDHVRVVQENHQLRQRLGLEVAAAPAGDVVPISAARNLAGKPLADIEKQVILSTLEQFKGHRVRTATALGIGVRTLGMKLKRWREEGEPIISRSTSRPTVHVGT